MILLQIGLGLTKASLMLTVKRFARSSLVYIYFIQTMVITVLIFTVVSTLILTIGCQPIRAAWEDIEPGRHVKCPGVKTYFAIMFVHMATDVIALVLPMPLLSRVKLPRLHRFFLILCFTLGSMWVEGSNSSHSAQTDKYKPNIVPWLQVYLGCMLLSRQQAMLYGISVSWYPLVLFHLSWLTQLC